MFVAKNNELFRICNGFSKMVSDMFPNSELAMKYGTGKAKTTQIVYNKGKSIFGYEETQCV